MKERKEIADKNYDLLLKINNDIIKKYESLESNSKNNKFLHNKIFKKEIHLMI